MNDIKYYFTKFKQKVFRRNQEYLNSFFRRGEGKNWK